MVVVIVGWVAATPFTIRHPRVVQRAGQAIVGPLQHLFEHLDPKPGQYSEKDISPYLWHNGQYPDSDEYRALFDGHFADYRLAIGGLVDHPLELDLGQLRALPHHEQITQHFCIQGWPGVAKCGGVSMQTILDLVKPQADAKWVVFYSLGDGPDQGIYYDAHPIEHMRHHLTMLAYDMNDEPLSSVTARRSDCATRTSSASSRSNGSRASSSSPTTPRWAAATAATTRTASSSDTGSPSEHPRPARPLTTPMKAVSVSTPARRPAHKARPHHLPHPP